jgi:hypothetical protein
MDNHEQYNLPTPQTFKAEIQAIGWFSVGNLTKTDKNVSIKDLVTVNDVEIFLNFGQRFKRTAVNTLLTGSIYSAAAADYLMGITSLSYAPTIGLPRPSLVGMGKTFIVKDEVGGAATTAITVRSAGEETIDGAATSTINTNYQSKEYYTDGTNWFTK